MYFRQVLHEDRSCASYIVGCPSHGQGAVIDPHIHADHVSGARALAATANVPVYLGSGADVGFEFTALHDGDVLEIGNRRGRVIHTPGHTPEHVSLFFDDWFVLTGDTLFVRDVGRVDLALVDLDEGEVRSRAKELHESLETLLSLRDDVEVYPGHYAG